MEFIVKQTERKEYQKMNVGMKMNSRIETLMTRAESAGESILMGEVGLQKENKKK